MQLRELFLFIELLVATKMEISKNAFKRCIESDIAFSKVRGTSLNIFYDLEDYGTH